MPAEPVSVGNIIVRPNKVSHIRVLLFEWYDVW